jgi:Ca2+-dependent lipid-binding protein
LQFDVAYFPVLKPQVSGVEESPESSTFRFIDFPILDTFVITIVGAGVVKFTIHQAKDLEMAGIPPGDLNAYAKVFLGSSSTPHHTTSRPKHTAQPVWESATEFLCVDRSTSIITVKVIDDREFLKDPTLGNLSVRLQDLFDASKEADRDWWPLSGCKSGRLRLAAEWKPLNMAGSIYGAQQYTPPIGAVRLWLKNATDVKNVLAALGGKVRRICE